MPIQSREVSLASRPEGVPTADNFSFATIDLPDPKPGEVLVRNLCMSVDPYMRSRMNNVSPTSRNLRLARHFRAELLVA